MVGGGYYDEVIGSAGRPLVAPDDCATSPRPTTGIDATDNSGAVSQACLAHPIAAVESPGLGGISTFDADGTLRTWNGTTWVAGAKLPAVCATNEWAHAGPTR